PDDLRLLHAKDAVAVLVAIAERGERRSLGRGFAALDPVAAARGDQAARAVAADDLVLGLQQRGIDDDVPGGQLVVGIRDEPDLPGRARTLERRARLAQGFADAGLDPGLAIQTRELFVERAPRLVADHAGQALETLEVGRVEVDVVCGRHDRGIAQRFALAAHVLDHL